MATPGVAMRPTDTKAGGFIDRLLDTLALVFEQPRTPQELIELTNYKPDTIYQYLDKGVEFGLLYIQRYDVTGRRPVAVYALQPRLFEHDNAAMPEPKR